MVAGIMPVGERGAFVNWVEVGGVGGALPYSSPTALERALCVDIHVK